MIINQMDRCTAALCPKHPIDDAEQIIINHARQRISPTVPHVTRGRLPPAPAPPPSRPRPPRRRRPIAGSGRGGVLLVPRLARWGGRRRRLFRRPGEGRMAKGGRDLWRTRGSRRGSAPRPRLGVPCRPAAGARGADPPICGRGQRRRRGGGGSPPPQPPWTARRP